MRPISDYVTASRKPDNLLVMPNRFWAIIYSRNINIQSCL